MPDVTRAYVLDTNVLMHDPTAMFRFEEHNIFLPMVVLEELDAAKKGTSEVARNARQASRFLDELITAHGTDAIDDGIPLATPNGLDLGQQTGKLYLQTQADRGPVVGSNGSKPDNLILSAALGLSEQRDHQQIVLVSKDINLRIKATIHGVSAEDYQNDRALDDLSLLFRGYCQLDNAFWSDRTELESWSEKGSTFYKVPMNDGEAWHPNQFLYMEGEGATQAIVREIQDNNATLEVTQDFGSKSIWGIFARNREQNFALNLLMDPNIDFVTLMGTAGTGKTLLSLASGLAQTLDDRRYAEIIMTRATVPVGEDIGFLPGTEEEKMTPWMGALTDNLEVLTNSDEGGEWGRAATQDLLSSRIKIRSLNFMRGRTFLNRFVIIDEAQNLTPKQMKTLLTRAGPGTKMVCLGNVEQIDTPYLTETTSGLTFAVDRFRHWAHSGHVTLKRGERSRLADAASEIL